MQGLEVWRNASARYAGAVACLVLYLTAAGTAFAGSAGRKMVMQGGSNGATPCVTCHGVDGSGNAAAGFPRLSSLTAEYMPYFPALVGQRAVSAL